MRINVDFGTAAQTTALIDAGCAKWGYNPLVPEGELSVPNPETKEAFFRRNLILRGLLDLEGDLSAAQVAAVKERVRSDLRGATVTA